MRSLTLLATMATLATAGFSQSPLAINWNGTTFTGGNGGNIGNMLFFNLTVFQTVTITQFDLNCYQDAPVPPALPTPPVNTAATVNVWLGPTTWVGNENNAALWTTVATAPLTTQAPLAATPAILPGGGFSLGPGSYGVALQAIGFRHGYSNPGVGVATSSNTQLRIDAGGAQNLPWMNPTFTPRLANVRVHYTNGGTPIAVASWQPYGSGCYGRYTSFYETWGNPISFNLSNTAMRLQFQGSVYTVSSVTPTFFVPVSAPLTIAATAPTPQTTPFTVLYPAAGAVATSTTLYVTEDGWISPVPSVVDATPTVLEFLNLVTRWCPHWKNQDTALGGTVHYDLDPNGTQFYITWNAIRDNNISSSVSTNTFQVVFFQTGDVEFRYQTMSVSGGGSLPIITGWTQGNLALDRGSLNTLLTSLPLTTSATDNAPLSLALNMRPQLGSTPTFQTTNISANTIATTWLFSFQQMLPAQDLAFLGAGGCFAHVNYLNAINGNVVLPPYSNQTAASTLPIPNNSAFNGTLVYGQSATLEMPAAFNALGLLTSNGVRMVVGSL